MGACRYHLGRQRAVQGRVPLGGDAGLCGCQVIKARQNFLSGAVGAAGAFPGPRSHSGSIGVSHRTEPPNAPLAGGRHL